MKRKSLNPYEARILTVMLKKNRWMTTAEIAYFTRFSWNTVDKYINRIYNRGWLSKNRGYWRARR